MSESITQTTQEQTMELERLRQENEILRQNAEAASRAPVSGGGDTDTEPEDLFLRGFNAPF